MNIYMLKDKIADSGLTQESIADAMGISRCTFYRKMKKEGKTFTVQEMNRMIKFISLTKEEAAKVFLLLK